MMFSCDHSEKFVLFENFNELRLRDSDFAWPLKQVKNAAIFHELSKITEEFLSWIWNGSKMLSAYQWNICVGVILLNPGK